MKNKILYLIKYFGLAPVVLLCYCISTYLAYVSNFNLLACLGILAISVIICYLTIKLLESIKLEGEDKNDKKFKSEVEEMKSAFSKSSDKLNVKVRDTTEVEISVYTCTARIENGKVKCIIEFKPQELNFDTCEEFVKYFCLPKE